MTAELGAKAYRLIGIGLSDLIEAEAATDFFAGDERRAVSEEAAADSIRQRFGDKALMRGSGMQKPGD
jgi:DNA polymerase-4